MIATLISFGLALALLFYPINYDAAAAAVPLAIVMALIGGVALIIQLLLQVMMWSVLQRAERHYSPYVSQLYIKDRQLVVSGLLIFIFFLFSLLSAFALYLFFPSEALSICAIWLLAFGVTADIFHHEVKRLTLYVNPISLVDMYYHQARHAIHKSQMSQLRRIFDALVGSATKGVVNQNITVSFSAINHIEKTMSLFLESSKSIGHEEVEEEKTEEGTPSTTDQVSYTLHYVLHRLELIYSYALKDRIEPICSHLLTAIGKIIIDAAKYDMTLIAYPLHCFGQLTQQGQKQGMPQIGHRALCTILEVAKIVITDIDLEYQYLKDPFFSLITQMNLISREIFRHDKSTSFKVLTQPFYELKQLLHEGKIANHRDQKAILDDVDRVLQEFETLEQVMRSIPNVSELSEEKKQQDSS